MLLGSTSQLGTGGGLDEGADAGGARSAESRMEVNLRLHVPKPQRKAWARLSGSGWIFQGLGLFKASGDLVGIIVDSGPNLNALKMWAGCDTRR